MTTGPNITDAEIPFRSVDSRAEQRAHPAAFRTGVRPAA